MKDIGLGPSGSLGLVFHEHHSVKARAADSPTTRVLQGIGPSSEKRVRTRLKVSEDLRTNLDVILEKVEVAHLSQTGFFLIPGQPRDVIFLILIQSHQIFLGDFVQGRTSRKFFPTELAFHYQLVGTKRFLVEKNASIEIEGGVEISIKVLVEAVDVDA